MSNPKKMQQKHIIHVVESFGSGIIEFISNIVTGLPEHKHTIIYGIREIPFESIKDRFPEDVNFRHWVHVQRAISIRLDLYALIELNKIFKELAEYDVIHLHSSKAGFLGRTLFMNQGKKIIYTPNGVSFAAYPTKSLKYYLFSSLEKIANLMGGIVVGTSESEANLFRKIGINASCINNGISLTKIPPKRDTERKHNLIVVTVGRITPQKNPTLFNEIATHFVNNSRIEFIWIGDGELRGELTSPNITITGWMTRKEVEALTSKSSVYLSTSLWEGLSFAVIEAMATSLPLLLSNCVGNKDMILNNSNGYLFNDTQSAVKQINSYDHNHSLIKQHGEASLKIFSEKFTSESMVHQYNSLYVN